MFSGNAGDFQNIFNLVGLAIKHEGVATVGVLFGEINQVFARYSMFNVRG